MNNFKRKTYSYKSFKIISFFFLIFLFFSVWEIATGRCVKTIPCGGIIRSVAWSPSKSLSLIAVAADKKVILINPGVGDKLITKKTDELLELIPQSEAIGKNKNEKKKNKVNN